VGGLELSKEEKDEKDEIDEIATTIMKLKRASDGKTPEPQDIISNLVNVKSMLERTGFPTYTILSLAVYLKIGYSRFGKDAEALNIWSNYLMEALIAYKRQQRQEAIEMSRRIASGEETSFYFGERQQQEKRRFWNKKPKAEPSEFQET
jgi:hypothetical protein